MALFYVYIHSKPTTGETFHIGKGKGKRAWDLKNGRNDYWKNVVNKHGATVTIIKEFKSEQDALDYEIELISYARKMGCKLTNMTDGGEGLSGHIFSKEHRRKIGEWNRLRPLGIRKEKIKKPRIPWNKGKKGEIVAWNKGLPKEQQPRFGVKQSPETIKKRVEHGWLGRKHNPESLKKRSITRRRNRIKKLASYQFKYFGNRYVELKCIGLRITIINKDNS